MNLQGDSAPDEAPSGTAKTLPATSAPMPTQIGAYDIVRLLGRGGMGVVYEGCHRQIGRRVAIKVLSRDAAADADAARRFFNEARAVNRIEHPSLVQISDYGQMESGAPYLVMEYLSGQTLRARLDARLAQGTLPTLRDTLSIAVQVAAALSAAHEKGIVHRDLKPENLMLVADPIAPSRERVKVLDFGIAKVHTPGGKKTTTGVVIGTPLYMSPEQCSGADETDDRTDVYSLGVILYELLCGQTPFHADGAGRIIAQHLFQAPVPLAERARGVPPALASFVLSLLHKEKASRPSMSSVCATLRELESGMSDALLNQAPVRVGSKLSAGAVGPAGPARPRWIPVAAAMVGLVVVLATGLLLRGRPSGDAGRTQGRADLGAAGAATNPLETTAAGSGPAAGPATSLVPPDAGTAAPAGGTGGSSVRGPKGGHGAKAAGTGSRKRGPGSTPGSGVNKGILYEP